MLELRGITKLYSGIPAVSDISFSAPGGEVTGYLGPNGSGKSTTIKMITGLIEPSEGEILFNGQPIDRNRISYRQRFGYVPEEPHLYSHLTGLEYLEMVAELRCLPKAVTAKKIMSCSACSHCCPIDMCRYRPIRRECGKKFSSPPHCFTTRIW